MKKETTVLLIDGVKILESTKIDISEKSDEQIILECDSNHEWIGESLGLSPYCSKCGVDKGNERNN